MLRLVLNVLIILGMTVGLGMLGIVVLRHTRSRLERALVSGGISAVIAFGLTAAMAEFARATLEHPSNHALGGRASVLQADVALAGKARVAAGLADTCVDYVIMNPPFNAEADRPTPKTLKREAHVMEASALADWMRSAAAVVRPRGGLAAIVRPEQIGAVLEALAGRFGSTEVKPIHARADAAAIRIVVRATRGARGKLVLRPPLFLHAPGSDRFSTEADAINNGLASLFGD